VNAYVEHRDGRYWVAGTREARLRRIGNTTGAIPAHDKTALCKGVADEYSCATLPSLDGQCPGPHA
jgi:hypothetical protein